jgi:hypothetical protein
MSIQNSSGGRRFTSPIGRGRIALAIRVRGYGLSIERNPSPGASPQPKLRFGVAVKNGRRRPPVPLPKGEVDDVSRRIL